MEGFAGAFIGGAVTFFVLSLTGLVLFILGLIFMIKNIKWKAVKQKEGQDVSMNILAIVLFIMLMIFGAIWFIGFGAGGIGFLVPAFLV